MGSPVNMLIYGMECLLYTLQCDCPLPILIKVYCWLGASFGIYGDKELCQKYLNKALGLIEQSRREIDPLTVTIIMMICYVFYSFWGDYKLALQTITLSRDNAGKPSNIS